MIGELTNHLWQTTIFAASIGFLTIAFRKNRAQVRYWMWLSASLKFLVPFSLLAGIGNRLWGVLAAGKNAFNIAPAAVSRAIAQITQPFPETFASASSTSSAHRMDWTSLAVFVAWLTGVVVIVLMQLRSWLRVRAALRASQPLNIFSAIPVRSTPGLLEPGVVGFVHQVLLLPEGIARTLTPKQLEAVIAHEQCHARRRDNLTSALHMIVEAIFWFYPLVWWIGARLIEEREHACDEAVLRAGNQPTDYVEGILTVCKGYFESPLRCVSGVTGSDLKIRVRTILSGRTARELSLSRKAALSVAALAAFVAPILVGAAAAPNPRLLSTLAVIIEDGDAAKYEKFVPEVVSIKRSNLDNNFDSWGMPLGSDTFSARNVTMLRILREVYALGHGTEDNRVLGGPAWFNSDRYDIDAKVDPSVAEAMQKLSKEERFKAVQHILLTILTDRCRLAVHRDSKELPIYVLVIAKGGSKLKAAGSDDLTPVGPNADPRRGPGIWMEGRLGPLLGKAVTMSDLASMLQYLLSRTVVDKTGLTGQYTFTVRWEQEENASSEDAEAAFLRAFPEQLGLKVESGKGQVEVIVIDRIEKPSVN